MEKEPTLNDLSKMAETNGELEALERAMSHVNDFIGEGRTIYTARDVQGLLDSLLDDYLETDKRARGLYE